MKLEPGFKKLGAEPWAFDDVIFNRGAEEIDKTLFTQYYNQYCESSGPLFSTPDHFLCDDDYQTLIDSIKSITEFYRGNKGIKIGRKLQDSNSRSPWTVLFGGMNNRPERRAVGIYLRELVFRYAKGIGEGLWTDIQDGIGIDFSRTSAILDNSSPVLAILKYMTTTPDNQKILGKIWQDSIFESFNNPLILSSREQNFRFVKQLLRVAGLPVRLYQEKLSDKRFIEKIQTIWLRNGKAAIRDVYFKDDNTFAGLKQHPDAIDALVDQMDKCFNLSGLWKTESISEEEAKKYLTNEFQQLELLKPDEPHFLRTILSVVFATSTASVVLSKADDVVDFSEMITCTSYEERVRFSWSTGNAAILPCDKLADLINVKYNQPNKNIEKEIRCAPRIDLKLESNEIVVRGVSSSLKFFGQNQEEKSASALSLLKADVIQIVLSEYKGEQLVENSIYVLDENPWKSVVQWFLLDHATGNPIGQQSWDISKYGQTIQLFFIDDNNSRTVASGVEELTIEQSKNNLNLYTLKFNGNANQFPDKVRIRIDNEEFLEIDSGNSATSLWVQKDDAKTVFIENTTPKIKIALGTAVLYKLPEEWQEKKSTDFKIDSLPEGLEIDWESDTAPQGNTKNNQQVKKTLNKSSKETDNVRRRIRIKNTTNKIIFCKQMNVTYNNVGRTMPPILFLPCKSEIWSDSQARYLLLPEAEQSVGNDNWESIPGYNLNGMMLWKHRGPLTEPVDIGGIKFKIYSPRWSAKLNAETADSYAIRGSNQPFTSRNFIPFGANFRFEWRQFSDDQCDTIRLKNSGSFTHNKLYDGLHINGKSVLFGWDHRGTSFVKRFQMSKSVVSDNPLPQFNSDQRTSFLYKNKKYSNQKIEHNWETAGEFINCVFANILFINCIWGLELEQNSYLRFKGCTFKFVEWVNCNLRKVEFVDCTFLHGLCEYNGKPIWEKGNNFSDLIKNQPTSTTAPSPNNAACPG